MGIVSLVSPVSLSLWPLDGVIVDLTCRSLGIFDPRSVGWVAVVGSIGGGKSSNDCTCAWAGARRFERTFGFLVARSVWMSFSSGELS